MKTWKENLKRSPAYSGIILFSLALIFYFVIQFVDAPTKFFTLRTYSSFSSLFKSYMPLILITVAQAYLMLVGIIDISIGIQMSFANVLAVNLPVMLGIPVGLAWVLAVLATVVLATIYGYIVSYGRIPPLLAGFAMIYIVKGINLIISPKPGGKIPKEIYKFYAYKIFDFIPMSVVLLIIVMLMWTYLKRTKLLKQVYAVGGNERNAFASGIDAQKVKVKMYVIAGFLTGIAGLCYTAAYTTGNPITGEIYGLQSISACILGGISLAGGWGTMSSALLGCGFTLLVQTTVPKIFTMISRATGVTYTTYYHNLVSDIIILVGLIGTIFAITSQHESLMKGLKKQLSGGAIK